jgi:ADP-ribose pyrophosphatase YjhB (NUDIX family)
MLLAFDPTPNSRAYPDRPFISVGVIVIHEERVLLVKRGAEPLKGQWSIPGGALELGETLKQGAVREALEETGLRVECGQIVELLDRIYRDDAGRVQYHYVLVDFLSTLTADENPEKLCRGGDAEDARWFSFSEIESLTIQEAMRGVLRKAIAMSAGN